jgi:sulfate adenylyltransferase subunit 1
MSGLLKFITCGSVDDGKSTLIGHLLYDAKLIYTDQEEALELDSKVGSRGGAIDYSLLLDGLMAEREQGITIDVAYRYFTTDRRSFICADTPGHEEYTRNMACGASFADLAVILIDAEKGVLIQTKRHARICALMGIRYFVFAVNKMDLAGYRESVFRGIEKQIAELAKELSLANVVSIPVSATEGDNITKRSENLDWYSGPVFLDYLETVDVREASEQEQGFYLPVQRVCRPNHEFRGFQGQIENGSIHTGDLIRTLPSKEEAHVKSILVADHEEQEAFAGQPVTIQLDREVDVSRGCVLESGSGLQISDSFETELLWMDDAELTVGKNYIIRLGTRRIPGILTKIRYRVDINTGEHHPADTLHKNEIAVCEIAVTEPVILDRFENHRTMGELILIDRISNMTSACGVVTKILAGNGRHIAADRSTRSALNWQIPYVIEFFPGEDGTTADLVEEAEFRLVRNGRHTYVYHPQQGEDYLTAVRCLNEAGIIVLLVLDRKDDRAAELEASPYCRTWESISKAGTISEAGTKEVTAETVSSRIFQMTNAGLTMNVDNWII